MENPKGIELRGLSSVELVKAIVNVPKELSTFNTLPSNRG